MRVMAILLVGILLIVLVASSPWYIRLPGHPIRYVEYDASHIKRMEVM